MTNPRPRSTVGTDAQRLAAQGMADGDIYTTETGIYIWNESTASWTKPVPADLAIYVATTGNDANDGLTAATPLLTVQAAVKLAGKLGWTSSCIVNLAAGTYNAAPDASGDSMYIPQGYGDNCGPLMFKGTTVDSGLGVLVSTGGTAGSGTGPVWQAATTAAVVQADDAFQGYFAVFTGNVTAALAGHVAIVSKQRTALGTTTWSFACTLATAPVAGDTFTLVKPASVVAGSLVLYGAHVIWRWVQFYTAGATRGPSARNLCDVQACWVGNGNADGGQILASGPTANLRIGSSGVVTAMPPAYSFGVSNGPPGAYFTAVGSAVFVQSSQNSALVLSRCVGPNTRITGSSGYCSVFASWFTGGGDLIFGSGVTGGVSSCELDGLGAGGGAYAMRFTDSASMTLANIKYTNVTSSVALMLMTSLANITNMTGSGCTCANPILMTSGARATFGAGNTITGTLPGNDVSSDGIAFSWAQAAAMVSLQNGVAPPPLANPTYSIAGTGNNAYSGTATTPLATVAEALRRLARSGWTGQPVITVANAVNEGASPVWNVPVAPSGALPILLQGTVADSGLGPIVPTGGTAGAFVPVSLPTITSAAVTVANAYRGMRCRFTGGALNAVRCVVDSNDGAGGFVLCGNGNPLAAAPSGTTPFVIENLVGAIGYTGTMTMNGPGSLVIDSVKFSFGTQLTQNGIVVVSVGCIFLSTAAMTVVQNDTTWNDGATTVATTTISLLPLPAGVVSCGSRWDGAAGIISFWNGPGAHGGTLSLTGCSVNRMTFRPTAGNGSGACVLLLSGLSSASACTAYSNGGNTTFRFANVVLDAWTKLNNAAIELGGGNGWLSMSQVSITNVPAATELIRLEQGPCGIVAGLSGANPLATNGITVQTGSKVKLATQPTLTVGGSEVIVGANGGATFAAVWNGGVSLAAVQTDLANAASQMCRVGP